jgi:hypothetical protein
MRAFRAAGIAVFTSTAILLPLSAARAGDAPKLKEGLWDVHGERVENPGAKRIQFAYRLCRDHAYDAAAEAQLKDVKDCTTVIKKLDGGKLSSASTCTVDGMTIVSNGLSQFTGDTAAHSETHATYTPPYDGKSDETMTEDQQYLGKCPAGLKPGDRVFPNGIIRHPDR